MRNNKVVLIVGGSSGIGKGIATNMAKTGAIVYIVARDQKKLDLVVDQIVIDNGEAYGIAGDATNESHVRALVQLILQNHGKIDILVNCVGIYPVSRIEDVTLQQWEAIIKTNLTSSFLLAREVIKAMKKAKEGLLIFIGSSHVTNEFARPDREAYYSSKGALLGLTRALNSSLVNYDINSLIVHPSWTVDTDELIDEENQLSTDYVGAVVTKLAMKNPKEREREVLLTPKTVIS